MILSLVKAIAILVLVMKMLVHFKQKSTGQVGSRYWWVDLDSVFITIEDTIVGSVLESEGFQRSS